MNRVLAGLGLVILLAACGADGEPVRPEISATVGFGSGGVTTATSLRANRGGTSLGVTL